MTLYLKGKQIFKNLISINTTNPPGNEMDIIKYILSIFRKYNPKYYIVDHGDNRGSLIIKVQGINRNSGIAFIGHIDTVPTGDVDLWSYPPFSGVEVNGLMYGRGTSDMKGGVTSMILAAMHLYENNIVPKEDIYFCFTADEEAGGLGITTIREKGIIDSVKEVFICEPSDCVFGIAEKGALWLNIKVRGKMSHASMSNEGLNALEKAMEFGDLLKSKIDTKTEHKLLGRNTVSITKFNSGVSTNIVPDFSEMIIDIRTIPGFHNRDILDSIKQIKRKLMKVNPGLHIEIDILNDRPALETDKNSSMIKKLGDIYKKHGFNIDYKGIYFYTDASQFIPYVDVPFVILGPGESSMAHQIDEYCNIQSVIDMSNIYVEYIMGL